MGARSGRELFGKVEEVVFAVGEGRMVDVFRRCFEDVVVGGKKEGEVEDNDEDSGRSNSSSS